MISSESLLLSVSVIPVSTSKKHSPPRASPRRHQGQISATGKEASPELVPSAAPYAHSPVYRRQHDEHLSPSGRKVRSRLHEDIESIEKLTALLNEQTRSEKVSNETVSSIAPLPCAAPDADAKILPQIAEELSVEVARLRSTMKVQKESFETALSDLEMRLSITQDELFETKQHLSRNKQLCNHQEADLRLADQTITDLKKLVDAAMMKAAIPPIVSAEAEKRCELLTRSVTEFMENVCGPLFRTLGDKIDKDAKSNAMCTSVEAISIARSSAVFQLREEKATLEVKLAAAEAVAKEKTATVDKLNGLLHETQSSVAMNEILVASRENRFMHERQQAEFELRRAMQRIEELERTVADFRERDTQRRKSVATESTQSPSRSEDLHLQETSR